MDVLGIGVLGIGVFGVGVLGVAGGNVDASIISE